METLKKIGVFFALFACVIGAGCSLGWLGYLKEWFAFCCELVVIGFAVPTFVKLLKKYILA
ncbi:MAG: hypothetical protein KBS70_08250 [Bacteroidales bacterium]|nr:hypothetical protein [Candidatus Colicola equi]